MIVGFTITDFRGHEEDAVKFIENVCILEDPSIARNIVNAGVGVNVFSKSITLSDLQSQPFVATPIEVSSGEFLLASTVNFNLEVFYNEELVRLAPTEYIRTNPAEIFQFEAPIRQGLLKLFPELPRSKQNWILSKGYWRDNGAWVDSAFWRD